VTGFVHFRSRAVSL